MRDVKAGTSVINQPIQLRGYMKLRDVRVRLQAVGGSNSVQKQGSDQRTNTNAVHNAENPFLDHEYLGVFDDGRHEGRDRISEQAIDRNWVSLRI